MGISDPGLRGPRSGCGRSAEVGERGVRVLPAPAVAGAIAWVCGDGAGGGDLVGDVPELAVDARGDVGEHGEGLLGRELVPLHEDALGLTDPVAAAQRRLQMLLAFGGGQRKRGVDSEDPRDGLGVGVEGVGVLA